MIIKLPTNGIHFRPEEPTHIGLDIAVNRQKGLRCVIATQAGAIWEVTLKFRNEIRLLRAYPFVSIPYPQNGLTPEYLAETFILSNDQAQSLSFAFNGARCIAIDGPPNLPNEGRRISEVRWHNHIIPGIKDRAGGIYWTPPNAEVNAILNALFDDAQALTTEQLTKLGQSLWIFVGFWIHLLFRRICKPTIEVYPDALRTVCRHIKQSNYGEELEADYRTWGGTTDFNTFITTKSESNDAAIACFAAYLHTLEKTEEISPNEIVIPLHQGQPFNN